VNEDIAQPDLDHQCLLVYDETGLSTKMASVDLRANSAGVMLPRAECGRCHCSPPSNEAMALRASVSIESSVSLRRSSRKRPLKLSTRAFCVHFPGAM
jgi:hypothetical protein